MPDNEETPVSIKEASHLLGVSETALRTWTDDGRVKAFITPGGHRRYLPSELKKFASLHTKTLGINDLVLELEETIAEHRELAKNYLSEISWFSELSRKSQEQLAESGRNLLLLIIRYISEPSRSKEILGNIREIGSSHGTLSAELQLPLTDAIEAFLLHRNPIINTVTYLLKKREAFSGKMAGVIPMIAYIMDEALISLVSAYQQHSAYAEREERLEPEET